MILRGQIRSLQTRLRMTRETKTFDRFVSQTIASLSLNRFVLGESKSFLLDVSSLRISEYRKAIPDIVNKSVLVIIKRMHTFFFLPGQYASTLKRYNMLQKSKIFSLKMDPFLKGADICERKQDVTKRCLRLKINLLHKLPGPNPLG